MLRYKIFILFQLFVLLIHGQQQEFQAWLETGITGKINKQLEYSIDLNNRFGNSVLQTSFGEISLKYKFKKWLKPSVDYRVISDRANNSNYDVNQRINFNLQFSKTLSRFDFDMRLRYQYSFNRFSFSEYEPEFDQAYRIKPSIAYDINNFMLTPQFSTEFFYNPTNGEYGNRFSKIRYAATLKLDIKGPHKVAVGYIFDQRIQSESPRNRHILSLNYTYQIKQKKKKKSID